MKSFSITVSAPGTFANARCMRFRSSRDRGRVTAISRVPASNLTRVFSDEGSFSIAAVTSSSDTPGASGRASERCTKSARSTTYTRPTNTDASKVGERRRNHWSRLLREKAYWTLPTVDMMAAEEAHSRAARSRRGLNKAAWINSSLRIDQITVVEVLQKLHLKNTGKEISRAEVLAALMVAGLETIMAAEGFAAGSKPRASSVA